MKGERTGVDPLTPARKARLVARILVTFVFVQVAVRRWPLPDAIARVGALGSPGLPHVRPHRLSSIVHRSLRIGPWRARCLISALVLYRLVKGQGDDTAEVVIGLPLEAEDHEAHAWVEIDGVDVGPPPGKGVHEELARYR